MAKKKVSAGGFMTGLLPTPRHILASAKPFEPLMTFMGPTEFAVVPKKLSVWGNNKYGVCVTSQEAFSKAAYSVQCGLPQTFVTEQMVIDWARKYGWLNGAYLTQVMDKMAQIGIQDEAGKTWMDGPYKAVDYSNEAVLQAAILQGPVNVGLASSALPSTAGRANGWFATSGGRHPNEDHCVALCGFGSAAFLYGKLGVTLPAAVSPNTPGYLLFTWGTIGFVTHDWIMGCFAEAWVRNPTTPGQFPNPEPTPEPTPPTPVPPTPPGPSPTPPAPFVLPPLHVQIPAQRIVVPAGAFGRTVTVTIPGQRVDVIEERGFKAVGEIGEVPWGELMSLAKVVVPIVINGVRDGKSAMEILAEVLNALTPRRLGVDRERWKKLLEMLLKLLPLLLSEPQLQGQLGAVNWAKLLELLLKFLPLLLSEVDV